jgi:hypothetical protein
MIQERLAHIQKELKAPKSQFNAFGKYNYRNCEDILEAVKPLLGGSVLIITDEIVMVGARYYVKARVTLRQDGEEVNAFAYAREEEDKKGMDSAQITGACSSYARKYALNGLFLIDDTKDADTKDNTKEAKKETPKPPSAPPPEPAKKETLITPGSPLHKKIEAMINEAGINRDKFKEWLFAVSWIELKDEKPSLSTLTEKRAKNLVDKWESALTTYKAWVEKQG